MQSEKEKYSFSTHLVSLNYKVISDRNRLLFPNLNKNEYRKVEEGIL